MIDPKNVMYEEGRRHALDLAGRAKDMDGTAIIAEEDHIPAWSKNADYSKMSAGIPVRDDGQVWTLIIPHNAAHYTGRPADLRSLWGLAHTKDPSKAKPWVASYGISGLYMEGEVCTYPHAGSGKLHIWRCTYNNNEYPPQTHGAESRWVDMGLA